MTKQEFEIRVEMKVDDVEFGAINTVYNVADVDKDEFCNLWVEMNKKRVEAYKAEKCKREEEDLLKWDLMQIAKTEYDSEKMMKYADDVLSMEDLNKIKKAGIELSEKVPSVIMGGWFDAPKHMYTIVADIWRYIE